MHIVLLKRCAADFDSRNRELVDGFGHIWFQSFSRKIMHHVIQNALVWDTLYSIRWYTLVLGRE